MIRVFSSNLSFKIYLVILLVLSTFGFFYFENSFILRIIICTLGLISIWQINSLIELIILFTFYLSLNDLYNIHYWRGLPIAVIMIAVFLISIFLFYTRGRLEKLAENVKENIYKVYLAVIGLSQVELFLAMGFWPVDPRTKSLVIVISFYLFSKVVYLSSNNMLSLKRIAGYGIITIVILAAIIILSF